MPMDMSLSVCDSHTQGQVSEPVSLVESFNPQALYLLPLGLTVKGGKEISRNYIET